MARFGGQEPGPGEPQLFWCPYCAIGLAVLGTGTAYRFSLDAKTRTLQVRGPAAVRRAVQRCVGRRPTMAERRC